MMGDRAAMIFAAPEEIAKKLSNRVAERASGISAAARGQ
jgi:hypothetical protein